MRNFQRITRNSVRRSGAIVYRRRRAGILAVVVAMAIGAAVYSGGFANLRDGMGVVGGTSSGQVDSGGAYSSSGEPSSADSSSADSSSAESKEPVYSEVQEDSEQPMNVLVMGVDKRPVNSTEAQVEGTRADTLMLVQVTPDNGKVELLSIPRDLFVEIRPGYKDRINAAYSYGGVEGTVKAVKNYTGLPIHHYAVVDFEGFEDVVNAMGGLPLDLEAGQYPPGWPLEPGLHTLKGHKALVYARYRKTAGGDLDRIQRQQEVVAALRSEAFDWSTVTELPGIMKTVNSNVETDLGLGEMFSLSRTLLKSGRDSKMTSDTLQGVPATTSDGSAVLAPLKEENSIILQDFRY